MEKLLMTKLIQVRSWTGRLFMCFMTGIWFLPFSLNANSPAIPDEVELSSGLGIAYGPGGSIASPGIHSIKTNPAQLGFQKNYFSGASYHWPTAGRNYYNVGFVDAKTSKVTAGVQYTGFLEKKYTDELPDGAYDSLTKDRIIVGLGTLLSDKFSLGINAVYTRNHVRNTVDNNLKKKAIAFGGGFVMKPQNNVSIVGSAQNIFNQSADLVNPKTYTFGASYVYKDIVQLGLEYKNRKRMQFEQNFEKRSEQLLIGSAEIPFRQYLNIIGSYTYELKKQVERRTLISGGIEFRSKNLGLGYMISTKSLNRDVAHHAVNLDLKLQL